MVLDGTSRTDRPEPPYLACDSRSFELSCGIEGLFLPQDKARDLPTAMADGEFVARIRIDSRGNAALLGVEPR